MDIYIYGYMDHRNRSLLHQIRGGSRHRFFEFVCNDELVHLFVGVGGYYVLVMDVERLGGVGRSAVDCHDPHPCQVVGRIHTEVLWLVLLLNNPVVYSSHRLHKVSQSSSVIRGRFIDKFVVDKRPYSFILMHMRPNIEIDQSFA